MRRRFLKCLEQGIESIARQHVNFVDDVDLVARRNGGIAHRLDDLAHIVDAGVAGGVHLDHVDMAAFGDRDAGLAHAAGIDRRAALPVRSDAVERLGDQPRGGGLADPAHAGHQEGMGQPLARDRIGQRPDHRILADQLGKGLRSVFARQHAVGLRGSGSMHRRWRLALEQQQASLPPVPPERQTAPTAPPPPVRQRLAACLVRFRFRVNRPCALGRRSAAELSGRKGAERPAAIRCGCFLPDLTRFANANVHRLPRRIWRESRQNATARKVRLRVSLNFGSSPPETFVIARGEAPKQSRAVI